MFDSTSILGVFARFRKTDSGREGSNAGKNRNGTAEDESRYKGWQIVRGNIKRCVGQAFPPENRIGTVYEEDTNIGEPLPTALFPLTEIEAPFKNGASASMPATYHATHAGKIWPWS